MYRTKVEWCGKLYHSLSDILEKNLDIVFVGLNPSVVSVEMGHYHTDRLGRRFWNAAIESKLFVPEAGMYNDELLLEQRMGITDIVKRPTRNLSFLTDEDFEEGRSLLLKKVLKLKPGILCSIYKTAFEKLLGTRFTNIHGYQENYRLGKSLIFVLASPFLPHKDRLANMLELKELREQRKK